MTSVVSGKQLLWDRGVFGEFSLVLCSKVHELALVQAKGSRVPAAYPNQKVQKFFSYLIGANFTDPKTGQCAWTNQSSSQGPLGIKLSLTSTKHIET